MDQTHYHDTEIIERIRAGEVALYEILIRRYNGYLYKIGRSYGYGHEDTQDLMQDTFVAAYFALPKFENRAAFKTWIFKIMLNHCYRKKQKLSFKSETRQPADENATPLFASAVDTGKMVMNRELNAVIEQALGQIPEIYRMVFTLREINGLNLAETADVLNIAEGNVKIRLNRAKAMLRTEIEKSYAADEIFEFNLIYCNAVVENVMARIGAMQPKH